MAIDIDLSEVNQLAVDLHAAPPKAAELVKVVMQKGMADVKRDAKIFAPVDTGFLRGSITGETKASSDSVEFVVGPTASYGHYVELGTEQNAPAAYLGPSFDRNAALIERALSMVAEKVL